MQKIEGLYAWLVADRFSEGVVRRDTPIGTQPLISDDLDKAIKVLGPLVVGEGLPAKLVYFKRDHEIENALDGVVPAANDELPPEQEAFVQRLGGEIGRLIVSMAADGTSPEQMIGRMKLAEQALIRAMSAHREGLATIDSEIKNRDDG